MQNLLNFLNLPTRGLTASINVTTHEYLLALLDQIAKPINSLF